MRARDYRYAALKALRGKWSIAVLAGLIAAALGAVNGGTGISFSFDESEMKTILFEKFEGMEAALPIVAPILIGVAVFTIVYCIAMMIIGSVVSVGYAEFNLDLVDGFTPSIGTLFSRFGQFKTAFIANLLVFLRVLGGMFLFIIPGIIAAYRYAMVPFVLAENPGIGAADALEKSREIMWQNKWKLFCLDFSFIGWNILCALSLGIASLWIVPYRQAAYAAFYREATREVEYM